MGLCSSSANKPASYKHQSLEKNTDYDVNPIVHKQKTKDTTFRFSHTKHYERYFDRQFKVSVCAAKGERKTMEDDHLCKFKFSNHQNYSLFGIFDGHHGSEASKFLSDHLGETLNRLNDLENNENIIAAIQKMDKEFITNTKSVAGSTIVFAIIHYVGSECGCNCNAEKEEKCTNDINNEISGRIFWCGDARAYLVKYCEDNCECDNNFAFNVLTVDHNTRNKREVERVIANGGKIINGRIDGLLAVTRAFGDSKIKYDGSAVICQCEYKEFTANIGDSLLMSCDGLTEKWTDKTLMKRMEFNLGNAQSGKKCIDTAKALGCLVDDAICEGSADNISVMLIQFKDKMKQQICHHKKKYEHVHDHE